MIGIDLKSPIDFGHKTFTDSLKGSANVHRANSFLTTVRLSSQKTIRQMRSTVSRQPSNKNVFPLDNKSLPRGDWPTQWPTRILWHTARQTHKAWSQGLSSGATSSIRPYAPLPSVAWGEIIDQNCSVLKSYNSLFYKPDGVFGRRTSGISSKSPGVYLPKDVMRGIIA